MRLRHLLQGTAIAMASAFPVLAQDTEVTVVLSEELDIVDPCEASRSNVGRVVLQNISETMTELVPGEGLRPRLADSWEEMGDGTWRFNLHPDVKFTDGTALDAGDVAHSLERIKGRDHPVRDRRQIFRRHRAQVGGRRRSHDRHHRRPRRSRSFRF